MRRRSRLVVFAFALAFCRPTEAAARPGDSYVPTDPDCAGAAWAPAQAGMIVALDEETGAFGPPTRTQVQALLAAETAMIRRDTDDLVETRHPSGAVGVDLQGRFQELAVARVGADGRIRFYCVSSPEGLRDVLAAPAPAAGEDR